MLEFIVGRLREEPFCIAIRAVSHATLPFKRKRISIDNKMKDDLIFVSSR